MSKIEWCDKVWNPVRGCSRVSEGCRNCYAERVAARFSDPGKPFDGYAYRTRVRVGEARWTGKVALVPEKLAEPLSWRKPSRVFVNSMSDLFHERLPDAAIDQVFAVMAQSPRHTFQVLTKRAEHLRAYCASLAALDRRARGLRFVRSMYADHPARAVVLGALDRGEQQTGGVDWPLPNVWLGVSVEDQKNADERIPSLLQTPAAVRFVSYEPALGPVDLEASLSVYDKHGEPSGPRCNPDGSSALGWVIVGGESGPGRRPVELAWLEAIDEQTREAGVPLFVKQDGAPRPGTQGRIPDRLWARKEFPR